MEGLVVESDVLAPLRFEHHLLARAPKH